MLAPVKGVVGGNQVRTYLEAVLDAPDGEGEAGAAVGQHHAQLRPLLQHAAEGHAAGAT